MTNERNRPDLDAGLPAGIARTGALFDEALREPFSASGSIAIKRA